MATKLNGNSILSGIYSGLTSTYSLLADTKSNGVTLESITNARNNPQKIGMINQSFASFMQTNFASLDKDGDGVISSAELSNLTNQMATQGLTQAQLMQLGSATGISGSALEQVLAHFNQIDTNHDGKVTTAEISAYGVTSQIEKKRTEFAHRSATNMSSFYSDDSSAESASSILDARYLEDSNNS